MSKLVGVPFKQISYFLKTNYYIPPGQFLLYSVETIFDGINVWFIGSIAINLAFTFTLQRRC